MKKLSYDEQALRLSKAIDVAVNVFEVLPPKEWDEKSIKHVIKTYLEFKHNVLNPKPQFKNITSLKYSVEAVFYLLSGRIRTNGGSVLERIK